MKIQRARKHSMRHQLITLSNCWHNRFNSYCEPFTYCIKTQNLSADILFLDWLLSLRFLIDCLFLSVFLYIYLVIICDEKIESLPEPSGALHGVVIKIKDISRWPSNSWSWPIIKATTIVGGKVRKEWNSRKLCHRHSRCRPSTRSYWCPRKMPPIHRQLEQVGGRIDWLWQREKGSSCSHIQDTAVSLPVKKVVSPLSCLLV